jgi:hypothetical protein
MVLKLTGLLLVVAALPAAGAAPPRSGLAVASVEAIAPHPSVIAIPGKPAPAPDVQPAPMPNPDIDPPHGEARRGADLEPAFLSEKVEFQGNGFSPASNLDYAVDQRTRPAAGINLSVPVK